MTGVILLFLLGLVLMVKGGDSFVEGAEWMARVTGIPPFVVAATVVSLGTTMPELLVSTMAAAQGSGGMALGNAVGSVSCNTGLILGISLLFLPGKDRDPHSGNLPAVFAREGGPPAPAGEGNAASAGPFGDAGLRHRPASHLGGGAVSSPAAGGLPEKRHGGRPPFPLSPGGGGGAQPPCGGGLYLDLAAGARLLVDNGCILARLLGVPEAVVALTLVALGTSLPELVTTITALARGQSSLSVGNIIGANFLDLTLVPAVSSFAGGGVLPMDHPLDLLMALLLLTVSLLPSVRKGRFRRWQGLALLVLYGGYITLLF